MSRSHWARFADGNSVTKICRTSFSASSRRVNMPEFTKHVAITVLFFIVLALPRDFPQCRLTHAVLRDYYIHSVRFPGKPDATSNLGNLDIHSRPAIKSRSDVLG